MNYFLIGRAETQMPFSTFANMRNSRISTFDKVKFCGKFCQNLTNLRIFLWQFRNIPNFFDVLRWCATVQNWNESKTFTWDVVYLGWSIAPSYMSPNAAEGGKGGREGRGLSQCTGAQINFGDLTPYLTYIFNPMPHFWHSPDCYYFIHEGLIGWGRINIAPIPEQFIN